MIPITVASISWACKLRVWVGIIYVQLRKLDTIIRFTQFFQLRIPKTLPFLFLPNANLNPDFEKRITAGGFQATSTCPGKSNDRQTSAFAGHRLHTTVLDTDRLQS